MELIDLDIFATVVEQRTATRAAKVLGMTQPGISKHLARLEEEVGGPLFTRSGKYLVLNEFGEFYYTQVKKILGNMRELSSIAYGASSPVGVLKLGLTDAATLIVTPPSLVEFRTRYAGIHISLDIESSTHIEDGVLDRTYDLGFVTTGVKQRTHLAEEILYADCIDAVVAANHPLAQRKVMPLSEIAHYPLIISPRRRRTRAIIDRVFQEHGIRMEETIDVYIHTAAVQLSEAGLGVALLPRMFVTQELRRHQCAHLRIKGDPIKRTLSMVHRDDMHLSAAAAHFREIILERTKKL